jgi:hypothetical protein
MAMKSQRLCLPSPHLQRPQQVVPQHRSMINTSYTGSGYSHSRCLTTTDDVTQVLYYAPHGSSSPETAERGGSSRPETNWAGTRTQSDCLNADTFVVVTDIHVIVQIPSTRLSVFNLFKGSSTRFGKQANGYMPSKILLPSSPLLLGFLTPELGNFLACFVLNALVQRRVVADSEEHLEVDEERG